MPSADTRQEVYALEFLQSVQEYSNGDGKKLVKLMQYKVSKHKQPTVVPGVRCAEDADLLEQRTSSICQVPRVSMTASAHPSKDGFIEKLVTFRFCYLMIAVTFVNGG